MNQFNNETLRFQDKIVLVEIPETIKTIEIAIEMLELTYQYLYGVIIAIFGKNIYSIKMNKMVTQRTLDQAKVFLDPDVAKEHLVIIPFPKL